jgi:NADPH:quinone reductase-like Zn-dependent oxidoreductase
MRAIVITRHGGPGVLQVQEKPDPAVGAGEVRFRVKRSGINFADLMARLGLYPDAPPVPCVVGYEVSGVVEAVGAGVTHLAPGMRVLALCMFGGYADTVVVPAHFAQRMPEGMGFDEGAALPVNYGTAYHMLHHMGALKAGETVFVQSAAGGVGVAAIDLINAAGGRVIGLASSSKHDFLRRRGVTDLVGRNEDPYAAIKRLTNGRGVDLFLDSEGGPDLRRAYGALGPGGRLICFGVSSLLSGAHANKLQAAWGFLMTPRFNPFDLMNDNRAVIGVNMNSFGKQAPEIFQREMAALMGMYAKGLLKPHVDATFPPERAGEAHQYMHDRKNKGKVVIVWP